MIDDDNNDDDDDDLLRVFEYESLKLPKRMSTNMSS